MRTPLLLALLALTACDKGAPAPSGGAGEAAPKAPEADALKTFTEQALPQVNAARPSGATIEFEAQKLDRDRIVAAVPKGWKAGVIPGSFEPGDQGLGFMTRYSVGTNCDGTCEAKDWPAIAEKVNLGQFRDGGRFELVEEQALTAPTGKLLVAKAKDGGKVYISAARWKDGAERYLTCSATLDGEAAAALVPAFKAACANVSASFLK